MNNARLVNFGIVSIHTSWSQKKENKEINNINIDNKITIKSKNGKI